MAPLPVGAVYNQRRTDGRPVATGRELARYFESETPGLPFRHALNFLMRDANWSPLRQARAWMALDVAIYSALLAAWHYKWFSTRKRVAYRPRPFERDPRVSVLYNRKVNESGSGDGDRRVVPAPSPGSPRHPSYPAGHSAIGGAGSELLSFLFPDYRAEFDDLGDNCGMGRLWAGVHYRSDHVRGVALGRTVARLVVAQLERDGADNVRANAPTAADAPPPTQDVLQGWEQRTRPASPDRRDAAYSDEASAETARGPQEGAAALGSSADAAAQARGPQEGAEVEGSSETEAQRARGPQEGTRTRRPW
jgi:hypothetical protein